MKKYHILYNPLASNNGGYEKAKELYQILKNDSLMFRDITKITDLYFFIKNIPEEDAVIICGGDGTLNRFVNSVDTEDISCDIYCYATGSGNDFLRDIDKQKENKPVLITKYLKNLPKVTVKGNTYKFLNNASFGLDGFCCEEADRQRKEKGKSSAYALIAIKGLLSAYKPRKAVITVDSVTKEYENVWLAPTMNGRFFGGGLMATPGQDRLNEKHSVSVAVMHNVGKLKALMIFPSMFKGKHIKYKDVIKIIEGNEITITYDKPAPMQLDGETIPDVITCTIKTV